MEYKKIDFKNIAKGGRIPHGWGNTPPRLG